jgi:hypothetical protein
LYGVGQWLGLSGHRTSHQLTSSYEVTLKPWFTRRQILKRVLLPVRLGEQQPSGNGLEFLSANVSLCCFVGSCLSRSVAVRLNICSKLVRKTFFFRILQWLCLISKLSQTQFYSQ